MITIEMLRKDIPEGENGSIIALWNSNIYDKKEKSNYYIHPWVISNPAYYRNHLDKFVGWYPLQQLEPEDY